MKKNDLIKLNIRREVYRRLRFVKDRMRDMPVELSYAEGKIATLPKGLAMPSDWALAAARLASKGVSKHIDHLAPREGRKYTGADLAELPKPAR